MEIWYVFALLAMFGGGIQNFGYKLAAEEGCNSATLLSSFIGTGAVLGAIIVLFSGNVSADSFPLLAGFAAMNAMAYVVRFLARQEALKLIPLVIGLPLMKMSTAVVVVIGVLFLGESLTVLNMVGVILSLAVVWLLTRERERGEVRDFRKGALFLLLVIAAAVLGDLVVNFAAKQVNNFLFLTVSYTMMFFPALFLQEKFSNLGQATNIKTIKWGTAIGAINFLSFSSLLMALRDGPISLVFPITTLGMAISVALSMVVLGEDVTKKRVLGLLTAIIALSLMRV